jgi:hypothetical protein
VPLAADNTARLCGKCHREQHAQLYNAPTRNNREFFETDAFRAAFQSWNMGRVFTAYRNHPRHLKLFGKALNQETLGRWLGLTQAQVSKIEHSSRPETRLDILIGWAQALQLPSDMLWFDMPNQSRFASNHQSGQESSAPIPPNGLVVPQSPDHLLVANTGMDTLELLGSLSAALSVPDRIDSSYVETLRSQIGQIVALDNRFGGAELARLSERFFRTLHKRIGAGSFERSIRRDLLASAGELAEVSGWLSYDANRQDAVRRMNQEALYFTRLAGDTAIELLTLQNASMHAGFMGQPQEALDITEMVLAGQYKLSPRVEALFLTRKARALAQGGDTAALRILSKARSLFEDGVNSDDPAWAWWIDESELSWHEGMCQQDLGDSHNAVDQFERSVAAAPVSQIRSQYVHRAYLFEAQVNLRSWSAASATARDLIPLATEVASTRTIVLLQKVLRQLTGPGSSVPSSFLHDAASLNSALDYSPV